MVKILASLIKPSDKCTKLANCSGFQVDILLFILQMNMKFDQITTDGNTMIDKQK